MRTHQRSTTGAHVQAQQALLAQLPGAQHAAQLLGADLQPAPVGQPPAVPARYAWPRQPRNLRLAS